MGGGGGWSKFIIGCGVSLTVSQAVSESISDLLTSVSILHLLPLIMYMKTNLD